MWVCSLPTQTPTLAFAARHDDGASCAEGLSTKLTGAGIAHRSLYLKADSSLIAGGPWLADLYHHHLTDDDLYEPYGDNSVVMRRNVVPRPADPVAQIEALLGILTDSRAAVFWIGDASLTEEILYQHLRGLNRVTIATEPGSLFKTETVTFRHADANVMAQVLPVLDEPRYARFLGPALAVLFTPYEEWGGDCIRARNLKNPLSFTIPKGPLHWDQKTLDAISETRMVRLSWSIADYLRDVAPDKTGDMSDEALRGRALDYMREAKKLGVTHDVAYAKWSYMRLTGTSADFGKLQTFMTDASVSHSANDRVKYLMEFQINQLQEAR
ncbi:hypothetical protein LH464_23340 [Neorhizobium sp. T786]|uniref:hypothetical protein n=1 Tax=Pseudorhizobium xiangyangii TaxID=2883104 RepID=UPI001CFFF9D9|nr:hypothetical protein [Neorhizobium xiangyangii]MCB5205399.1 hypothetical protein [Neorhizobium xiangyangii]